MNILRILRLVVFLLLFSTLTHAAAKQPIVCSNTYALCSSAKCQPIPGISDKVLCTCSIQQGKNVGFSTCETRKEKETRHVEIALISTFSLGDGHKQYMTCSLKTPWANCLDKPCLVDKNAPKDQGAYCTCDIVRNQAYVTFAGKCDTKNCNKAIWSGATLKNNQQLMNMLATMPSMGEVSKAACPI